MLQHTSENEKLFKSFPIDEQTMYVTNTLTLANLYQLRLEVQCTLEPKRSYENSLQYLFTHRFYELFRTWLLESCQNSTENTQKALSMIDHNIDHFTAELFDKASEFTQPDKNQRTVL
jgi:hypothetical protein